MTTVSTSTYVTDHNSASIVVNYTPTHIYVAFILLWESMGVKSFSRDYKIRDLNIECPIIREVYLPLESKRI